MSAIKTSFGEMDIFIKHKIEYLKFKSSGRSHKHDNYESFLILSGSGEIQIGERKFAITKGDFVTIPPHTPHWMWPAINSELEGLVIYHEEEFKKI